jgi:hypothetical protein
MMPLIWGARIGKFIETGNKLEGWGRRQNEELLFNGYKVSVWDDEKVLVMESGECCSTVWI